MSKRLKYAQKAHYLICGWWIVTTDADSKKMMLIFKSDIRILRILQIIASAYIPLLTIFFSALKLNPKKKIFES
jgi:hypothetical protein